VRELSGRVAVITGAASGIGLALAEAFAAEGSRVVAADIDGSALEAAIDKLRATGAEAIGVRTDVSRTDQIEALATSALEAYGAVHVLCNNAGVGGQRGRLWEVNAKNWDWLFAVNLWAAVAGVRTFVPLMMAHGDECHIVNTASMQGVLTGNLAPGNGIYAMTKHALVAYSEALYGELIAAEAKIGVSVLLPGITRTNIWAAEKHRPAELADDTSESRDDNDPAQLEHVLAWFAGGQKPALLADLVVQAVRANRFWIPANPKYRDPAVARAEGIFDRTTPDVPMPDFFVPGSGW
jgi:NAD(P)-dependent dehydrogenase (short-subunit alcohol dehydrogenase family)